MDASEAPRISRPDGGRNATTADVSCSMCALLFSVAVDRQGVEAKHMRRLLVSSAIHAEPVEH